MKSNLAANAFFVGLAIFCPSLARGDITVSLASVMNGDSYMSENAATGSFAQINLGNGSLGSVGALTGDNDGLYNLADFGSSNPQQFGSADLFPREANFLVGSITYDDSGITGSGVETAAITGLDTSEFWSNDPNRTAGAGGTPSIITDLSDHAFGIWFFDGDGEITFGALDASDTVTLIDGQLSSIDLEVSTTLTASLFTTTGSWNGTFAVSGNEISYQIDDTFAGQSRFIADLTGTVTAVSAVPEPGCLALLGVVGAVGMARRRSRSRSSV